MGKSSLNIKSFRDLLANQNKNYKISPNAYHQTEVKVNGLNGSLDESTNSCSIEDVYSIKLNKSDSVRGSECNQKNLADVVCGNIVKLVANYNNSYCLPLLTPVACSVSVIIIVAAIAGRLWISTEEKIPWLAVNTSHYRNNYTVSYIIKSSNASLWIMCTRQALDDNRTKLDFTQKNCTRINHFAIEKYQADTRDSTNESNNVIPYTITLSAPLLIISFIILLISYLLFLLAICSQKYKIFYFVAGIGYIISGLISLSGLIMFISIFKSEMYHKLRTETSTEEQLFVFHYGESFILYVIGFVVVELSGILNVCLFNKLQKIAENNQNHFQLNSYVKIGLSESDSSGAANTLCQHSRVTFPPNIENGYLPNKRRCSLHAIPTRTLSAGDGFNKSSSLQVPHFDELFHCQTLQTSFKRNASTSTLDLVGENDGDIVSTKSNHRMVNIAKDKSSVSNKLDFNNICGMMRSTVSKSKEPNVKETLHRLGRLKPAKNVYYIEERKDDEPNIFIIDPATVHKHKKLQELQKSLEDVRVHKMKNIPLVTQEHDDADIQIGWNFMDRNYYGSRTLPRDFARQNVRPSLGNFLNNAQQNANEIDRSDQIESNCSHSNLNRNDFYLPPPNGYAFHHSSFDELSSSKSKRSKVNFVEAPKVQEYQWPKVIPKSPSSFSMNSFRLHRQPAFVKCPTYNPIDEFDLDKIEYERRKSHTTLFKENIKTTDFGTAV